MKNDSHSTRRAKTRRIIQIQITFTKIMTELHDAIRLRLFDRLCFSRGGAFCIFNGNTPASLANTIRPTSEVNVFNRVPVYANVFRLVKSREKLIVGREGGQ